MAFTNTAFVIDKEGYVWGTGENDYGQLGIGNTASNYVFTKISNEKFKYVYSSHKNTVLVHEDGSLWGMGQNDNGALGLEYTSQVNTLTMIHKGPFIHATVNNSNILAIDANNELWGAGYLENGVLGIGGSGNLLGIQKLPDIENKFKTVALGGQSAAYGYVVAADLKGDVYAWGFAGSGQYAPLPSSYGSVQLRPVLSLANQNIKKIEVSSSEYNTLLMLSESGKMYAAGHANVKNNGLTSNVFGYPTVISTPSVKDEKIIDISMDYHVGIALNDKGEVFTTGYNYYGSSFKGTSANDYIAGFEKRINIPHKVTSILSTQVASFIITDKGEMYGSGIVSRLGIENSGNAKASNLIKVDLDVDLSTKFTKIAQCQNSTLLLDEEGFLYGAGQNYSGTLGDSSGLMIPKVKRLSLEKFKDFSIGYYHSVLISKEGFLYGAGRNNYNTFSSELGNNNVTTFTKISNDIFKKVYAAYQGTFALREDGTLFYIGVNSYGESGDGSRASTNYYKVIGEEGEWSDLILDNSVYSSPYIFAAVKKDGSTWIWGKNASQLITKNKATDLIIPLTKISDDRFISMTTNGMSYVFIKEDGSLWMLGAAAVGKIGNTVALGSYGGVLIPVSDEKEFKKVQLTDYSIIALKKDGSVYGSGNNAYSELGVTNPTGDKGFYELFKPGFAKDISSLGSSCSIITTNGEFISSGTVYQNSFGLNTDLVRKIGFSSDDYLQYPLSLAGRLESNERVYDVSKEYSAVLGGYIAYKLNALNPIDNVPENTGLRYTLSKDGASWNVYRDGSWNVIQINELKTKGMTTEEVKALTKEQLTDYSFSEIRVRLTMWTTDENASPTFYNMSAYVDVAAQKPMIETKTLQYKATEMVYPEVSLSTDGTNWNKAEIDKVNLVAQENNGVSIKLDLSPQDEIDAMSYSFD